VGPMSDSGVLAPVSRPVGLAKARMTKPTKRCDVMRSGCGTSSR
jgi:hypothetical protein